MTSIASVALSKPQHVAVIGAGIAGAACARALTQAGHAVHVFDKSRGPGGRLATRRLDWVDRLGQATTTRLDHGAVGFTAQTEAFQGFVDHALQAGWLATWTPVMADGSLPLDGGSQLQVPVPDMPELCRRLLDRGGGHLVLCRRRRAQEPARLAGVERRQTPRHAVRRRLAGGAARASGALARPPPARLGTSRVGGSHATVLDADGRGKRTRRRVGLGRVAPTYRPIGLGDAQ